jgi:2-desacetyl-2-hydroxyethyl bacteriochlorophyllide A dehydrogenase
MRALVLVGARQAEVREVEVPHPGPGDVVVDVHRVGVCGTDVEFFAGTMAYLASGRERYPMRPGHEWSGAVREVGAGVDPAWLGVRVTGDTMLGCGACDRCATGRRHVCRDLIEVGISMGYAGALAERLRVPASSLLRLPDVVDDAAGALVEPGGNAWRAAAAAHAGPGRRVLVWGAGTIGLLAVAFAAAAGAEVHLIGRRPSRLELARRFGAQATWAPDALPDVPIHAAIDATDDPSVAAAALGLVEPGGRLVCIGLAGSPSMVDTRDLALGDITAVGLLSGSPGLAPAIEHYADGTVDPHPLVGATVALEALPRVFADALDGAGGAADTRAPKIHVDPRT